MRGTAMPGSATPRPGGLALPGSGSWAFGVFCHPARTAIRDRAGNTGGTPCESRSAARVGPGCRTQSGSALEIRQPAFL